MGSMEAAAAALRESGTMKKTAAIIAVSCALLIAALAPSTAAACGGNGWPQTYAGWIAHNGYSYWASWLMHYQADGHGSGHPQPYYRCEPMGSGEFYNTLYAWFRTNNSAGIPYDAWFQWHGHWDRGDLSY